MFTKPFLLALCVVAFLSSAMVFAQIEEGSICSLIATSSTNTIRIDTKVLTTEELAAELAVFARAELLVKARGWEGREQAQGRFYITTKTLEHSFALVDVIMKRRSNFSRLTAVNDFVIGVPTGTKERAAFVGDVRQLLAAEIEEWQRLPQETRESVLEFLRTHVFTDPLFISGAVKYVREWQPQNDQIELVAKTFLENLERTNRLNEFAAQARKADFKARSHLKPLSVARREDARKTITMELRSRIAGEWPHYSKRAHESILNFVVQRILTDPLFQNDSLNYIDRWSHQKHLADAYPFLNEPAKTLLKRITAEDGLSEFTRQAYFAEFDIPLNVTPLSSEWQPKTQPL